MDLIILLDMVQSSLFFARSSILQLLHLFFFMAGYFVNVDALSDKEFSYKHWIIHRWGRLCIPFMIWSLLYSGLELLKIVHSGNEIHWFGFVYQFIVGKSATPFCYIVVLV